MSLVAPTSPVLQIRVQLGREPSKAKLWEMSAKTGNYERESRAKYVAHPSTFLHLHACVCIFMCVCMRMYVCIYIYIQRDRGTERERERSRCKLGKRLHFSDLGSVQMF